MPTQHRTRRRLGALLLTTFLLGLWATLDVSDEPATPAAGKAKSVAVEVASYDQMQAIIAKHKGKVVVVDYWSSWCAPCLKELPEFVQLHQELGDQIVCLTVDVDFAGTEGEKPDDHRANVLEILNKNRATMRNFICSDPDTAVFDKLKVASVPTLHVFDRDGKLRRKFDNETEPFAKEGFSVLKHVRPLVHDLLK